jgi:hypothetical protein
MSDEFEAVKAVATHPATGGGIVAFIGWLGSKVYRGIGHRIANVENAQVLEHAATWKELDRRRDADEKIFDMIREHEKDDADRFEKVISDSRDRHDELMALIGDVRTDIAALKK